ncbi:MAG: arginine deiminase family protein [Candidatus Zixiibacteriota bacterium]
MKFSRAIVRIPCRSLVKGLTTQKLGKPDYAKAFEQHTAYVEVLKASGLEVVVLDPDEAYPDSVFVEDTALLTPECAIITNPGALSRRGETERIEVTVREFYENVERIEPPGTLDGGDVLMVGSHYYIGLSTRTNPHGAWQLINYLKDYGLSGSTIALRNLLHLKSGAAYLENNTIVLAGELRDRPEFGFLDAIIVADDESYAANCVWVNGRVMIAGGFPETGRTIESYGYDTVFLDMSEFRKLDGGLSCLSLRF